MQLRPSSGDRAFVSSAGKREGNTVIVMEDCFLLDAPLGSLWSMKPCMPLRA